MSKTLYRGTFAATVEDFERLPDDMSPDDVWESLRAALYSAAAQWYEANPGLLACEPDVG
ncbi:hypothetical protein [Nocardia tengchongensis]|uniref:hypothetical protein n=1 Tax=Nocardia tengchongensis TaxID=2055889 RepID=UPI0036CDE8B7